MCLSETSLVLFCHLYHKRSVKLRGQRFLSSISLFIFVLFHADVLPVNTLDEFSSTDLCDLQ